MQWVENLWLQQIVRFLADQANEPMQVTTLKADKKLRFPSISSIVNIRTFGSKIVISKLFKKWNYSCSKCVRSQLCPLFLGFPEMMYISWQKQSSVGCHCCQGIRSGLEIRHCVLSYVWEIILMWRLSPETATCKLRLCFNKSHPDLLLINSK